MANLSDFLPLAGGGGLTPKFEEFNSSGTFTPTQALIDAGGYIEVFLVGGGGRSNYSNEGASGGEVLIKTMYLTSVTGCTVTIGAGGPSNGSAGGSSEFLGSSAGGYDLTAAGGRGDKYQYYRQTSGWGANNTAPYMSGGSGVLGYGVGGAGGGLGGVTAGKANSGAGSSYNYPAGSGYCLIKWYE